MASRVTQSLTRAKGRKARAGADEEAASDRKILGVDPGLDCTGYAVVEADSGRLFEAGLIRSTTKGSLAQRLGEIEGGMEEILSEHDVDLLVVEDLFAHYKHPRTAILMGHARGVILLAAARHGADVLSVSATKIKKALTGNGHASKLQMQRAIMATFGLEAPPEPADVADALAGAFYAVSTRAVNERAT